MYEDIIDSMLPKITAAGMSTPEFQTILSGWQTIFRGIYGDDIYIEPDSKDGVLLSLIAYAMHGGNNAAIATWNAFSPATGTGAGLASNVKINGISRKEPSNSTVDVRLIGQVGIVIRNASVRDSAGNLWDLPAEVELDIHGQAVVTATAQKAGAITALPGDVSQIATPTRGWQSVTNPEAATAGKPVETDAELRQRQALSVALPSRTVMEGLIGAIANITGVTRYKGYDNDTSETDINGVPAHAVSMVVDGGDAEEIARIIAIKKSPGAPTFGTTTVIVKDAYGTDKPIHFFRPTKVPIYAAIKIKVLPGYTSDIGEDIKKAVSDYINTLYIGDTVYFSRLYVPATLGNAASGKTYDLMTVSIGKDAVTMSEANIPILFNESATCSPENIAIITVA
ncbi:baseplate J/gp47 family protein [Serratia marcescens]|uniref:baseplate J/gp47 family protein n=1 Tax=Serratia marcescens TaxID=615 RepID=UPI001F1EA682|nr:baseplate J/gp47 family protein [Serratia marcescens]